MIRQRCLFSSEGVKLNSSSKPTRKSNSTFRKPTNRSGSKSTHSRSDAAARSDRNSNRARTGNSRYSADSAKRTESKDVKHTQRTKSGRVENTSSLRKPRSNRDKSETQPTRKFDTPRRFRGDLPRRERDQRARGTAPIIDDDVTGDELGDELTAELKTLPTGLTITVAQHLVMVERYLEINPEIALVHAEHAKSLAGRFPLVREIVGIANYANSNWQAALNEFRAARRMHAADHLLPMMADCERGLGRPERALKLLQESTGLTGNVKIEAAIVAAGARSDLGQYEAALVALKIPELTGFKSDPSAYARLCFAYGMALKQLKREAEARSWFVKADQADPAATFAGEQLNDAASTIFLDDLDDQPSDRQ